MAPKKKKADKKKRDEWNGGGEEVEKHLPAAKNSDRESSDDEVRGTPSQRVRHAGAFSVFAALASDEGNDDFSDMDESAAQNKSEQQIQPKVRNDVEKKLQDVPGKAKGKKSKKIAKENEELDAILAELEKPVEKSKKKAKKEAAEENDRISNDLNAGIKQIQISADILSQPTVDVQNEAKDSTADTDGDAATAAAPTHLSRKQLKAMRKQKKILVEAESGLCEEEIDLATNKLDDESSTKHDYDGNVNQEIKVENESEESQGVDRKKEKEKLKKKKDKEKKFKEEEKRESKKDSKKKKHVDLIRQLLRERQEAEERLAQQVREEEERLEAIRKAKEEEERLAQEKKEREKQKKKEREERLKTEGKYLTPAQKEKLRRQQALLRNDNIILPTAFINREIDESAQKRPIYAKKKQKKVESKVQKSAVQEPHLPSEDVAVVEKAKPSGVKDDIEVPDSWDIVSEAESESSSKNSVSKERVVLKNASKVKMVDQVHRQEQLEKAQALLDRVEQEEGEDSSTEDEDEDSSEEEQISHESRQLIKERVRLRFKRRAEIAESKCSVHNLRAPVICVLGHVDTGKTKMLDTIRRTNVQDGEAGGITQQIGATQIPALAIRERVKMVRDFDPDKIKIPGFLVIDTPGHESFSNLRTRGSSLCDYAILVVDIMHGIEPQTLESLKLLLKKNTPFVIALNKIDRLYEYSSNPRKDVFQHLKSQPINTQLQFKDLVDKVVLQFAEQGVNVCLSSENTNRSEYISMIPTSAYLGDGIGNVMTYIVNDVETRLSSKLAYSDELECVVMEVKSLPGLGTTIDVVLINGRLSVGDIIVLTGSEGAIITQIRELLMPEPMKELRVKNAYQHFQTVNGAQGVKVLAKNLEKALAGLPLHVAHKEDEIDVLKEDSEAQFSNALMSIKKKTEGVYVQASTLGSLEALLDFLKTQKIPYSNVNIGPVHRRDVQKASAMLERKEEYACILAFDVRVDREVEQFAASEGVRIFSADIIYHLEESFLKYREELRLKSRRENEHLAIFPCKLRIFPQCIFNARNPIIIGVSVEAGQVKRGTPICVPSKDCIQLGTISSIERNHEQVEIAKKGDEICIKIENTTGEAPKLYGRHFDHTDTLVSQISRETIDACKNHFRNDLSQADWQLIVGLKKVFEII